MQPIIHDINDEGEEATQYGCITLNTDNEDVVGLKETVQGPM